MDIAKAEITNPVAKGKDKILAIHIDEKWNAHDFIKLFELMNDIYIYKAKAELFKQGYTFNYFTSEEETESSERKKFELRVNSIKYNSPGWIEFIAPGAIILSMFGLLKYYVPNSKIRAETRKISAEALQHEIEALKSVGIGENEIKEIIRSNTTPLMDRLNKTTVKNILIDGKIIDIDVREVDEDRENSKV